MDVHVGVDPDAGTVLAFAVPDREEIELRQRPDRYPRLVARGELVESSSVKKTPACTPDYVCESFCDTAAWLYAGVHHSPDFTLAARWRNFRRSWFEDTFGAKMK